MIRIGVIGTSNWTERMYMTALQNHPDGQVVAVCARDPQRTKAFAERWNLKHVYTDWRDLLDSDNIDAVIVSSPNHTHFPITMHALKNDLHVLCEKPLALNYAQADAMATEAERRALVGVTAFTYWHFPHYQYVARLVEQGYVGTPYHLNIRYNSGLGLKGDPLWRFDRRYGGEGAVADIGSHAFSLARLILGDIIAISAHLTTSVTRKSIPTAHRASDGASVQVRFKNGASGTIDVNMVSYQPKRGGQKQALELSGSEGTLYYTNDFSSYFSLKGAKVGDEIAQELTVPVDIWLPEVRRATPREMYPDLFQKTDTMAREFVSAIADGRAPNTPDLREGAEVQKLIDAAVKSHQQNSEWIQV